MSHCSALVPVVAHGAVRSCNGRSCWKMIGLVICVALECFVEEGAVSAKAVSRAVCAWSLAFALRVQFTVIVSLFVSTTICKMIVVICSLCRVVPYVVVWLLSSTMRGSISLSVLGVLLLLVCWPSINNK